MKIWKILKEGLDKNASDIIITWWSKPSLKINWDIEYIDEYDIISKEDSKEIVLSVMTETQKEVFLKNLELDFSIELSGYSRFRVNAFSQKDWYWLVFRPIKDKVPDFDDLWLQESIRNLIKRKNWLILITWSVWSWKTTTMASLINEINKTQKKHIITIEDPIEFIYKNNKSIIEQREVWVNTNSFENWLKYALRQASDVIMIWEMRDLETFRLALRAAETWNLVIATLHTSGAPRTVARVIDMFEPWEKEKIRQQLSESLIWVVWQQLLKTADKKWRVVATEVLINNTWVANLIRKNQTHQLANAIETWKSDGMITMKSSIEDLFWKWVISEEVYEENLELINKYL